MSNEVKTEKHIEVYANIKEGKGGRDFKSIRVTEIVNCTDSELKERLTILKPIVKMQLDARW